MDPTDPTTQVDLVDLCRHAVYCGEVTQEDNLQALLDNVLADDPDAPAVVATHRWRAPAVQQPCRADGLVVVRPGMADLVGLPDGVVATVGSTHVTSRLIPLWPQFTNVELLVPGGTEVELRLYKLAAVPELARSGDIVADRLQVGVDAPPPPRQGVPTLASLGPVHTDDLGIGLPLVDNPRNYRWPGTASMVRHRWHNVPDECRIPLSQVGDVVDIVDCSVPFVIEIGGHRVPGMTRIPLCALTFHEAMIILSGGATVELTLRVTNLAHEDLVRAQQLECRYGRFTRGAFGVPIG